ncbi:hypothetical protein WNZ14_17670 [Hoeflea sp. AS60]|uniref:hypothetical protein n=1 Tax=Hoeflea sp. AS60 TaxID=3135780 RepID=UPI00317959BD
MKILSIVSATLVALAAAPGNANDLTAQDLATQETTSGEMAGQKTGPSNAAILEDLRQNSLSSNEILAITAADEVEFVSLESFSGAGRQELEETLGSTEDGMGEVQTAFAWNETLEAVLDERDVMIRDLVAATRSDTGTLTVYIDMPSI